MISEYQRLGGWTGLPQDIWNFIEEYTNWDTEKDLCAPLYDLTVLLEDDTAEHRHTEEVLRTALENKETNYRELQKISQRLGIHAGKKMKKMIKAIGNLVPNYKISRYLKYGEIDNFNSIAEYHKKEKAKAEKEKQKKIALYNFNIGLGLRPGRAADGTILYWYRPL